jgi:hypothetical protein
MDEPFSSKRIAHAIRRPDQVVLSGAACKNYPLLVLKCRKQFGFESYLADIAMDAIWTLGCLVCVGSDQRI